MRNVNNINICIVLKIKKSILKKSILKKYFYYSVLVYKLCKIISILFVLLNTSPDWFTYITYVIENGLEDEEEVNKLQLTENQKWYLKAGCIAIAFGLFIIYIIYNYEIKPPHDTGTGLPSEVSDIKTSNVDSSTSKIEVQSTIENISDIKTSNVDSSTSTIEDSSKIKMQLQSAIENIDDSIKNKIKMLFNIKVNEAINEAINEIGNENIEPILESMGETLQDVKDYINISFNTKFDELLNEINNENVGSVIANMDENLQGVKDNIKNDLKNFFQ